MIAVNRRPGFTLVELLIVMGVIVLVAAILVPVSLTMTERNQVPRASSQLENTLQVAKSRAVAEKRPAGIRLIAAPITQRELVSGTRPAFAWYNQIQYIQDPGDYVEAWVWGLANPPQMDPGDAPVAPRTVPQPFWTTPTPYPGQPIAGITTATIAAGNVSVIGPPSPTPPNPPGNQPNQPAFRFTAIIDSNGTLGTVTFFRNQLLFGPISTNSTQTNSWIDDTNVQRLSQRFRFNYHLSTPASILPGDKIEVLGIGELFTVVAVTAAVNTVSNVDVGTAPANRLMCPIIALDRPLPRDVAVPLNGRPNYRVIRQPRYIPALQTINLPQGVVIDLTGSRSGMLGNTTPPADLSTTGDVYMSNVSSGLQVSGISGLTTNVMNPRIVAPPYIDILFSPSGEVLVTAQNFRAVNPSSGLTEFSSFTVGSFDMIALWVHAHGDPNMWGARQTTAAQGHADNQNLVTIHSRTGAIASYPLNLSPAPLYSGSVVTTDPLYNVRVGRGRLSADTNP